MTTSMNSIEPPDEDAAVAVVNLAGVKPTVRRPCIITHRQSNAIDVVVPEPDPVTVRAKRFADVGVAAVAIVVAAPLILLEMLLARTSGHVFSYPVRLGRHSVPIELHLFENRGSRCARLGGAVGLHRLGLLFDLLCGRVSLVGPRLVEAGVLDPNDLRVASRFAVRPGLISPRPHAGQDPLDRDAEYAANLAVWRDLLILLSSIVPRA